MFFDTLRTKKIHIIIIFHSRSSLFRVYIVKNVCDENIVKQKMSLSRYNNIFGIFKCFVVIIIYR